MGSLINQLVRKSTPSLRNIAASLKCSQLWDPLPASILHTVKSETNFTANNPIAQNPTKPLQLYYPSFRYGYFLDPISSAGIDQLKAIEGDVSDYETDDSRTLWADSVKKKRKKKMNKHKYKKLRKRLRRKT